MQGYGDFTHRRGPFWDSLAERVQAARTKPSSLTFESLEALAIDYRRLLQDYASARVRFPDMAATRRLEALAVETMHLLLDEPSSEQFGLGRFLGRTVPESMRKHAPYMGACVLLFASGALLALSGALLQPAVGLQILGPEAIRGLEQGELWTAQIGRTLPQPVAAAAIAANNMGVAIGAWAGGALFGAGALFAALYNGLHLGAAFGTTMRFGLAGHLLEFVSAHGPLELTLILVCAGHGLAIGHAAMDPGDRSRGAAAARAARPAAVGLAVALPCFALLGFIEAFVSPDPSIPATFKSTLGVFLLVIFLLFAFQPGRKAQP